MPPPNLNVQTTLSFNGRTEEAVTFYRDNIGAEILFMSRFRESPDQRFKDPKLEDKIYHATFRIGTTELMASDCGCSESCPPIPFQGFAFALRTISPEQAEQFFAALSAEGQVELPLMETHFASRYGIVTDKFGISWKVTAENDVES